MMQSEASKKLQEYAKTTDRTYSDFVSMIGRLPQLDGIDEELWAYVEANHPNYDQLMETYARMSGMIE